MARMQGPVCNPCTSCTYHTSIYFLCVKIGWIKLQVMTVVLDDEAEGGLINHCTVLMLNWRGICLMLCDPPIFLVWYACMFMYCLSFCRHNMHGIARWNDMPVYLRILYFPFLWHHAWHCTRGLVDEDHQITHIIFRLTVSDDTTLQFRDLSLFTSHSTPLSWHLMLSDLHGRQLFMSGKTTVWCFASHQLTSRIPLFPCLIPFSLYNFTLFSNKEKCSSIEFYS